MKKIKFFILACFLVGFSYTSIMAQCLIDNVVVESNFDCDMNLFEVTIEFTSQATTDSFTVHGNGVQYGTFAYINLPITIGGLEGNGTTIYEFIITDSQIGCSNFGEIGPVDCSNPDCNISDITVQTLGCNPDGTYNFTLDFNFENVNNAFFDLEANGTSFGIFEFSALPLTINNFPASGNTHDQITICQNDNQACCESFTIEAPNCINDCAINDLIAEAHPCDANGMFLVDIDFNIQNPPSDSFTIVGNGNDYGTFHYDNLFITIGPLEGDGTTIFEFIIIDQNTPSCTAFTGLEPIDCNPSPTCLEFENLAINTVYGSPNDQIDDVIFTENNVPVKIQEFENDYMNVVVQDNNLPIYNYSNFSDNFISFVIASLEFNFLQTQDPVIRVEFDYWHNGGNMLIGANDAGNILSQNNTITTLDGIEIAPGVTLTVTPDATNPLLGHAVLDGFVGLFTIGGEDAFAIDNVCVEYANLGDCWSGDTDLNNIVSNFDLLNIGVAYGAVGSPRQNASTGWLPQPSDDWNDDFENGVNYKHADANGDGVVNASDKFAIEQNYNLTHGNVEPFIAPTPSPNSPALFLQMPDPVDIIVGQPFEAEIHLGDVDFPMNDFYGLAFTLSFNDQIFDASSMQINFENGWANSNGTDDLLTMQHKEGGTIQAAMTRINQSNASGNGKIGTIVGIIDDLSGYASIELSFTNIKSLQANEVLIPINNPENYVEVITNSTFNPLAESLLIFPNPVNDMLFIKNKKDMMMDQIRVVNIFGKEVLRKINLSTTSIELNMNSLPEGIYILEILSDGFRTSRKIEVLHP